MPEEEENGGDIGAVLTYKRRKRSSTGSGSVLQGGPSVSSGDQFDTQQAREVDHLFCDNVPQLSGCTRMEHHRIAVLEEALLSQDADDDGIWSLIKEALASNHLGITNNPNAHGAQHKYAHEGNGNLHGKAEDSFFNADKKRETTLQRDTSEQADFCVVTEKWQKLLIEVLTSEKFAFLCNFLLRNFPGIKPRSIIDLSQIQSKMKNVAYGHIGQFHHDLQQVWERIQKIGQEMVFLANSLSNLSQAACHKQRSNRFDTENSSGSHTTTQFPYESEPLTKPEETEISCLYKVSICKHCSAAADGKCSLICDGCETTYHFSCVKPAVHVIPTQSWYCSTCTRGRKLSAGPDTTDTSQDSPHQNCVVCDRLKAIDALEQQRHDDGENLTTANNSGESSVCTMESEEPPQLLTTALTRLCKICGTCEDDERKFIECAHSFCDYKYYHIRCLRTSQIASQHQHHGCWYCPSCLCRACLVNKDDNMIVMCDGCDEAYHTYCMKPSRTSVPEGKWYCVPCNILRAKEGMRRYEQWVLQQHGQSDGIRTRGSWKSAGMLLGDADKVGTLVVTKKNR